MREFTRRMKKVSRIWVDTLNRIPSDQVVNKRYNFRLDPALIAAMLAEASNSTDNELLEGGESNLWFYEAYIAVAYIRGTAQEFNNLAQQSPSYKAGQQSINSILRSDPYRRRIALIRAREFEEMKGLSAKVKADMSRILTDGIGRGKNPREIARTLTDQTGINARRGHRIARTEIGTALRRARWDEDQYAQDEYGLRTMLMHLSALSPTTRPTHASRHAKLYTQEQVRDWYSRDGNAINCKCSQVSVLVDENNQPVVPSIIERAKKMLVVNTHTNCHHKLAA